MRWETNEINETMGFKPDDDEFVYCPHEFQEFVGCNDGTAKELAGYVYDYATDDALQSAISEGVRLFTHLDTFINLTTALALYDVYTESFDGRIVLHRYECPPIGKEARNVDAFCKYIQRTKNDEVCLPCNIPDIIRAFGEFGGKEVDQDIVASCFGFYDDPACTCPVCGKSWKRTWD